jgi:hypothetical protein
MKEYIPIKIPATRFKISFENLKKANDSPDEYGELLEKILNEASPSDDCDINEAVAELDKAIYNILSSPQFPTISIKALDGLVELSRFCSIVYITFKKNKLYEIESKEI